MSVDSCGFPLHFKITGGEVHDSKMASELIKEMPVTEYVVGDKGYDSEAIRQQIEEHGSTSIIPRKSHSKRGMMIWIGTCINIAILLKIYLQESSIFGQ